MSAARGLRSRAWRSRPAFIGSDRPRRAGSSAATPQCYLIDDGSDRLVLVDTGYERRRRSDREYLWASGARPTDSPTSRSRIRTARTSAAWPRSSASNPQPPIHIHQWEADICAGHRMAQPIPLRADPPADHLPAADRCADQLRRAPRPCGRTSCSRRRGRPDRPAGGDPHAGPHARERELLLARARGHRRRRRRRHVAQARRGLAGLQPRRGALPALAAADRRARAAA